MNVFKNAQILILLLFSFFAANAQKSWENSLNEMIDAENRFAKMASETDIKTSFLAYLDSNGVIFNDGVPGNGIALYSKLKEGKDLLTWYPVVGQVSLEGDMGFTSGPYQYATARGQEALFSGYFFSVWKRNDAGTFKVVLDAGLQHSGTHREIFKNNPKPENVAEFGKPFGIKNIREEWPWKAEAEFTKLAEKSPVSAYQEFLGETSLILRADQKIRQTKTDNIKLIEGGKLNSYSYNQLYQDISSGKDFAYCHGEVKQTQSGKVQHGFYVRVWQFQKEGWKIAADQLSLFE